MANYGSNLHLVREPEKRNHYTGFPEQAFYRPPSKENNPLLGAVLLGLVISTPFWAAVIQVWPEVLHSIERTVGK